MAVVSLAYGDSGFSLPLDPDRFRVIVPERESALAVREHLIDSPPLSECASGKRVLVIVSDLTRPTGAREFLRGVGFTQRLNKVPLLR